MVAVDTAKWQGDLASFIGDKSMCEISMIGKLRFVTLPSQHVPTYIIPPLLPPPPPPFKLSLCKLYVYRKPQ